MRPFCVLSGCFRCCKAGLPPAPSLYSNTRLARAWVEASLLGVRTRAQTRCNRVQVGDLEETPPVARRKTKYLQYIENLEAELEKISSPLSQVGPIYFNSGSCWLQGHQVQMPQQSKLPAQEVVG